MAAKTFVKKQKSVAFVYSAATSFRERIVEKFVEQFPGTDPQQTQDAIGVVIDALALGSQQKFQKYEIAETALAEERGDDAGISAERNASGARVVSLLVEVRQAANSVDPTLPQELGFKGNTPREFDAALATGKYVVSQLEKMQPVSSKVLRNYVFNPADYADLGHAVTRLEAAQTEWIADGRENDAAMVDRNRAEEINDRSLSSCTSILSAFLKASGEELLASRVGAPGRTRGTIAEFDAVDDAQQPVAESA